MDTNMNSANMEKCASCHTPGCGCGRGTGLFLIRLALGIVFIAHGISKFQDIQGTITFFGGLGFAPFLAYFVAAVETLGGLAMLLGVFTRWAGYLLAAVMLVAIAKLKFMKGFAWPMAGRYELELVLLLVSLGVSSAGPGRIGLFKNCHCGKWCMGKCQLPESGGGMEKK